MKTGPLSGRYRFAFRVATRLQCRFLKGRKKEEGNMRLRSTTLALLSVLAASASAQEQSNPLSGSPVVVGSRVRLRSTAVQGRPRGLVVALDDTSLTLSTDGGLPLKVGLASITSLDASLGRKRNALKGLAAGALAGVLIGLSFAVDPNNCGPESTNLCSRGEGLVGGSIVFGGIGAGVGALIKSDRWAPVTLSATPQVDRRGRGLGLAIALRF